MRIHRIPAIVLLSLAALAVAPGAAPAQVAGESAGGVATVVGADSLFIGEQRFHLFGIDALEDEQNCFVNGRPWACGAVAYRELEILVQEGDTTCVPRSGSDPRRPGTAWATCTSSGRDLAEEMVLRGYALAVREMTEDYVAAERAAEEAGVGVWRGLFIPPWEHRETRGRI